MAYLHLMARLLWGTTARALGCSVAIAQAACEKSLDEALGSEREGRQGLDTYGMVGAVAPACPLHRSLALLALLSL